MLPQEYHEQACTLFCTIARRIQEREVSKGPGGVPTDSTTLDVGRNAEVAPGQGRIALPTSIAARTAKKRVGRAAGQGRRGTGQNGQASRLASRGRVGARQGPRQNPPVSARHGEISPPAHGRPPRL